MEIKTKYNIGDTVETTRPQCKSISCPICEGEGHIYLKEEKFSCPKCGGDGFLTIYEICTQPSVITHIYIDVNTENEVNILYNTTKTSFKENDPASVRLLTIDK